MKILTLIVSAVVSVAALLKQWFSSIAKKEKEKRNSVDKTTSGIGNGKPFCLAITVTILLLIFITGCGYIYTISTPMTFDPDDFQYVKTGDEVRIPKDGYYFSNEAMEKYIRSKIAEYEMRKKGFFHKDGQ